MSDFKNQKYYYSFFILYLFLSIPLSSFSQTQIQQGEVSGIWTKANSPYLIQGEITILADSTLVIEPGVTVKFQGHYKFKVMGRLLAIGVENDSIIFTCQNPDSGWHGIRFENTPSTNDSSKIIYCNTTVPLYFQ